MDSDAASEWFTISDEVPAQRCGLTTTYPDSYPGNVTCCRFTWKDFNRCIWHADTEIELPTAKAVGFSVDSRSGRNVGR